MRLEKMEHQVELLMEALRLARHKQSGASSEKSDDTLSDQLNEAEAFAEKAGKRQLYVVIPDRWW